MGDLSKLKTCNSDFEAQVLKGALNAEGIACMLGNENITNLYHGMISAFTGVDVLVRDEDYERAHEVMMKAESEEMQSDGALENVDWSFG